MKTIAVKICGITRLIDGLAALQAGADLLGFNFYPPSPRFLTADVCSRLIQELRASGYSFQAVGVFVNHSVEQIAANLDRCGLDLAQLSGDESPKILQRLGERAFKALRPAGPAELQAALAQYPARAKAPAYLVDAYRPGEYGGTGSLADWGLASGLAARRPILLAGGLKPDNVARAIRQVQPWGVDVASGVESAPGIKDANKMAAFVQACRQAAQSRPNPTDETQEYAHVNRNFD